MKLKEFNAENTISRVGSSYMSFNTKSGVINFNKNACDHIGLQAGDSLILHQDEEDCESWFIEKATDEHCVGFSLRGKDIKNGLAFNNATLARALADSLNYRDQSGKILIASQPTEFENRTLYGLLTASLKVRD